MSGGGNGYDAAALGGQFGNKLSGYLNNAPTTLSGSTWSGLTRIGEGAFNPAYSNGVQGAIGDFGQIASGQRFGTNDPGYATLRQNVANDATTAANSVFTNAGRFGANSHARAIGEGVGNALAGLDYSNFANDQQRQFTAAGMLPGLYSAAQMPAQQQLGLGEYLDQNGDPGYNRFKELASIFAGTSQAPGMGEQVPWWQQALGAAAVGTGIYGNVFGKAASPFG